MSAITSCFSAVPGHRPQEPLNGHAFRFADYEADPEGREQQAALDTPA